MFPHKLQYRILFHCNISNNVKHCKFMTIGSTCIFCTNDVIYRVIWHHLSSLSYQFSIFEDMGGWQPWSNVIEGGVYKTNKDQNQPKSEDLYVNRCKTTCGWWLTCNTLPLSPTGILLMGLQICLVYARSQLRWTPPLIGQQELVPAVIVISLDSLYLLGRCLSNTETWCQLT